MLTFIIKIYQKVISPFKDAFLPYPSQCKFYPTCSEYAVLALKKYGAIKGALKIIMRLLKCGPGLNKGGVDLP